jgi:uncharacterized protein YsxB (DUF464 family)
MIRIEMNTARLKLTVKGHAQPTEGEQYREACSAASALAQGLMYTISLYNGGQGATKAIDYKNDPGDLFIKIFPEPWAERELQHRFRIYGDGMQLLAESHPQFIEMIRDGERILPEKEDGKHE